MQRQPNRNPFSSVVLVFEWFSEGGSFFTLDCWLTTSSFRFGLFSWNGNMTETLLMLIVFACKAAGQGPSFTSSCFKVVPKFWVHQRRERKAQMVD